MYTTLDKIKEEKNPNSNLFEVVKVQDSEENKITKMQNQEYQLENIGEFEDNLFKIVADMLCLLTEMFISDVLDFESYVKNINSKYEFLMNRICGGEWIEYKFS